MSEAGARELLRRALRSGSTASLLSAAALAVLGAHETGHAAAPTNATSQWLWGAPARHVDRADFRHTATGYLIHHAASVFWAVLYERWLEHAGVRRGAGRLPRAAAIAALACVVDLKLTPPRLRPGFERRLSPRALGAVYAAFALGLAAAQ